MFITAAGFARGKLPWRWDMPPHSEVKWIGEGPTDLHGYASRFPGLALQSHLPGSRERHFPAPVPPFLWAAGLRDGSVRARCPLRLQARWSANLLTWCHTPATPPTRARCSLRGPLCTPSRFFCALFPCPDQAAVLP